MVQRPAKLRTVEVQRHHTRKRRPRVEDDRLHLVWSSSVPFYYSKKGHLVHRIKSGTTHVYGGEFSHNSATFWCGNCGATGDATSDPGPDKLHCQLCESIAVGAGLPPAHELLGRHVHIGKLRAVAVCATPNA